MGKKHHISTVLSEPRSLCGLKYATLSRKKDSPSVGGESRHYFGPPNLGGRIRETAFSVDPLRYSRHTIPKNI